MFGSAERPRRPRTVIQWHDNGSKPRVRHFLSDDAPPHRALILAGAMAVVSIAAVVSVIQYQRHGALPDVGSLVQTAQASPDDTPKVLVPADASASIHAAAMHPSKQIAAAGSAPSQDMAAPDSSKSARVEPRSRKPDAGAAEPVRTAVMPSEAAQTKALAFAGPESDISASTTTPADEPSVSAQQAFESLKGPGLPETGEPTEALAYAPVETPAKTPVPQAAPRAEKISAIPAKPDQPKASDHEATVRSAVNLRAGPSDGAKVLLTIPRGSKIEVAENCRHWCAVTYDGRNGFVYKSFIRR